MRRALGHDDAHDVRDEILRGTNQPIAALGPIDVATAILDRLIINDAWRTGLRLFEKIYVNFILLQYIIIITTLQYVRA